MKKIESTKSDCTEMKTKYFSCFEASEGVSTSQSCSGWERKGSSFPFNCSAQSSGRIWSIVSQPYLQFVFMSSFYRGVGLTYVSVCVCAGLVFVLALKGPPVCALELRYVVCDFSKLEHNLRFWQFLKVLIVAAFVVLCLILFSDKWN